jgi:hypothetical protein
MFGLSRRHAFQAATPFASISTCSSLAMKHHRRVAAVRRWQLNTAEMFKREVSRSRSGPRSTRPSRRHSRAAGNDVAPRHRFNPGFMIETSTPANAPDAFASWPVVRRERIVPLNRPSGSLEDGRRARRCRDRRGSRAACRSAGGSAVMVLPQQRPSAPCRLIRVVTGLIGGIPRSHSSARAPGSRRLSPSAPARR